jgi:DNA-binding NarL/FixJ family response regulator
MDRARSVPADPSARRGEVSQGQGGPMRVVLCIGQNFLRVGLGVLLEAQADMTVVWASENSSGARALLRLGVDMFVVDALPAALDLEFLIQEGIPVVLLVGSDVSGQQLTTFLESGVRGLIPLDADVAALMQAIRAVKDGRTWVAAALTHQLLAQPGAPRLPADGMKRLTRREEEILRVLSEGLSNKEIAARFTISSRTVKFHVSNVLAKLGLCSRAQAVALAHSSGYLQLLDQRAGVGMPVDLRQSAGRGDQQRR